MRFPESRGFLCGCLGIVADDQALRPMARCKAFVSDNEIGIGLKQQSDAVDQPADAEQTKGKDIEDSHTDFAFIEFVGTQIAEKQAQKKRYPLVFGAKADNNSSVGVLIRIGVSIVDDDVGLFCVLQFFDLAATVRAEHSGNVDLFTAVLAELEVLRCGIGGICIHDGSPSLVYII